MNELIQILNGGIGVALVTGIFAVVQHRANAKREEKTASKEITEKAFRDLIAATEAIKDAQVMLLEANLVQLIGGYMERGWIAVSEHKHLLSLHEVYARLGGNGTVAALMEGVKVLPMR